MSWRYVVREANGTRRRVEASAFPLSVGGPDAEIPVAGPQTEEPLAHLGLSSDEVFVQAASGTVRVNGTPVKTSQWLRDGDVIAIGTARIEIEARGGDFRFCLNPIEDKQTDPPVVIDSSGSPAESIPSAPKSSGEIVSPVAFTPTPVAELRPRRPRVRSGAIVFWVLVILLGSVAWALFSARSIAFEFDPVPDTYRVEGPPFALQIGGRFFAHPGAYMMIAEKEGYRPLETTFIVGSDRSQEVSFFLKQLSGQLVLTTSPEEGAVVSIDGEEVGVTPLEPLELEQGEYTLFIRADLHHDFVETVTIEGKGTIVELDATLDPAWGSVTFTSEPKGAMIRVAGKSYGPTPVDANLLEGTHNYDVILGGHKPYRGRVHVVSGTAETVGLARLELVDGNLVVLSVPGAVNVTVDGEYAGQTPLELELPPNKDHRLELSRAGYDSVTREVSVSSSRSQTITITLEPQLGEIELVVDPPDANLVVNGEARGQAHQTLQLPAVPHRIEIKKDLYEGFATEVTPRPGFPQTIEVQLKTLAEIKAASILPVIQTSKGQELRLVDIKGPKRFEMGASRREPGRRANEALRTVELTRAFYMATTEVTNREFREFRSGHRSGAVQGHNLEIDHHPVVKVTWQDAAAYCNWLSEQESLPPAYVNVSGKLGPVKLPTTGYRLPTEAEWALVARHPEGNKLKYSWGNALPVPAGAGNYADATAKGFVLTTVPNYTDGFPGTAPSESFDVNPLGMYNLGGNVAEWVHDLYTIYASGSRKVLQDPMGPAEGEFHVIRGGSFLHGSVTQLRLSFRDYGNKARSDVGFRIARYLE